MYSCLLIGVISDYLLIRNSSKKWPIYSGYSLLITAYFGSMNCILWIKSSSYQKLNAGGSCKSLPHSGTRTTDTQWRHKSKISEKLGRCGRQNMLPPYLKIWEWEWIFGRAVKAISSLGVRSLCSGTWSFYFISRPSTQNIYVGYDGSSSNVTCQKNTLIQ